jgi:peptidoglycan/LPS O-acetylase OafA/YrhL
VTAAPSRSAGQRRWVASAAVPPGRRQPTHIPRHGVPALNGIRGIAVALVVVGHGGIPGVAGGFIGVDVFFVLSGFLITSLLLDELGRTGRLDLRGFWTRRARRLLPALLLMVLAVVFVRTLFAPESVTTLRADAVAAFLWSANWAFIAHKADYFSQGATPSPLQHTWSLGVEEQYYLLWPLLLAAVALLLAALARRRNGTVPTLSRVRTAVFVLATVGALASAADAVLLSSDASLNRVYFGTDTRAQALLIGAAAAALLVRDWSAVMAGWSLIRSRWVKWAARVVPVIGLAVLAVVTHMATGSAAEFRRGLLTVVALAAVAVIVPVALDQGGPVSRVLALRPVVWLGVISYGVYLWHWPIFLVLNGERTGWSGYGLFAARCLATLAAAGLSWWLIEQPIRRWRPAHLPRVRCAGAAVATAAAVTMLVGPIGMRAGSGPDVSAAGMVSPVEAVRPATPPRAGVRLQTVSVFGDSVAWTLMRYLPPTPGISFLDRTTIGCGVVRGGPYRYSGQKLEQKPECDTWPERWRQRIAHDRPDVVLLTIGRWETVDRMWRGQWTHIGDDDFDEYLIGELNRALDILQSTGARVVMTTGPFNRHGERADGSLYPEDQPSRVKQWNMLLRQVAAPRDGVDVLDLNKKLAPNGTYTSKINGVLVRSDGVHPTANAVTWLTPWLVDAVS